MKRFGFSVLASLVALALPLRASAQFATARGARMPDFPPGAFSDGGHYALDDMAGKVVVLYFYEATDGQAKGLAGDHNAIIKQYAGKPVRFFAIGPGDSLAEVTAYAKSTGQNMPFFADALGVMQHRYQIKISPTNTWHYRVLGPDGRVVGFQFDATSIDAALANAKWKYREGGYDAKLNPLIEQLEWGISPATVKAVKAASAKGADATAESAAKLYEAVKAEGQAWLDLADAARAGSPIRPAEPATAAELYARVSSTFPGEPMAKTADDAVKAMQADKAAAADLAARKSYDALMASMAKAGPKSGMALAAGFDALAKKHIGTSTGTLAATMANEIRGSIQAMDPKAAAAAGTPARGR